LFDAKKTTEDIIQWIRGYFNENGADCNAVIGISGGKDSSIAAAICASALGKERVYGILMPYGDQYDISVSHELVSHLGIKKLVINIKDSVDSLLNNIKESALVLNKQGIINIPARIRMTILYAVSASVNGRVVNTCNLSEDYVGYSTKYGDSAGDFSPFSALTVTEVKAIGRELFLPSKFTDKIPEDGLTGLSDEENLGFNYDVLDKYIREGICENSAMKEKIDRMHKINLHKLNPMPCFRLI